MADVSYAGGGSKNPKNDDTSNSYRGSGGGGSTGASIANNLPAAAKSSTIALGDDLDRQLQIYDWADEDAKINAEMQARAARQKGASDWYGGQLNLQSSVDSLNNSMGNARNGSGLYDLANLTARVDDLRDVDVINTDKDNLNNIYFNLDQTLANNQNSRNQAISDYVSNYGDIIRNMASQSNGYNPDTFSDYIDENGHFNWDSGALDWWDQNALDVNTFSDYNQYESPYNNQQHFRNDNASDNAYNMLRNQVSKMTTSTTDSYQQRLRDERTRR